MSEATLSLAIASLADAVAALSRGDRDGVTAKLGQVEATLVKAAEQRARAPEEATKALADAMELASERVSRRIMDGQRRRG